MAQEFEQQPINRSHPADEQNIAETLPNPFDPYYQEALWNAFGPEEAALIRRAQAIAANIDTQSITPSQAFMAAITLAATEARIRRESEVFKTKLEAVGDHLVEAVIPAETIAEQPLPKHWFNSRKHREQRQPGRLAHIGAALLTILKLGQ